MKFDQCFKYLLSQALSLTKDHDKKKMPRVKATKCIGLVMATKGGNAGQAL